MMPNASVTVSMQDLAPLLVQKVSAGGTAEITVTGNSMRPLLLDRTSRVRLRAVIQPKRGDMILYRRANGTYVLHRLVKCEPDGTYTMCGDAQTSLEKGLRREQLLAEVESFARHKGWRSVNSPLYRLWWNIHLADRPLRRFWLRGTGYLRRHFFSA